MSDPREKAPAEMSDRELDAAVAQEVCADCGGAFPAHVGRSGRVYRRCLSCMRHRWRAYKASTPQGPRQRVWVRRDETKFWARYKVRDLLRLFPDARLRKCESCGGTNRVCAHHDDYYRPYDVSFLCSTCHGALHRKQPIAALLAVREEK